MTWRDPPKRREKTSDPLDPGNLLPFSREIVLEEGHRAIDSVSENEPWRSRPGRKRKGISSGFVSRF